MLPRYNGSYFPGIMHMYVTTITRKIYCVYGFSVGLVVTVVSRLRGMYPV